MSGIIKTQRCGPLPGMPIQDVWTFVRLSGPYIRVRVMAPLGGMPMYETNIQIADIREVVGAPGMSTQIFVWGRDRNYNVNETPEEILALIENAEAGL